MTDKPQAKQTSKVIERRKQEELGVGSKIFSKLKKLEER